MSIKTLTTPNTTPLCQNRSWDDTTTVKEDYMSDIDSAHISSDDELKKDMSPRKKKKKKDMSRNNTTPCRLLLSPPFLASLA